MTTVAPSKFRIPTWAKYLFGIGIVVFLLGAILLPSLCGGGRETPNRIKCAANLKQIGNALELFAKEHGGKYPEQLSELIATEDLTPRVFICPSGSAEASIATTPEGLAADLMSDKHSSYIYLKENAGLTDRVVVYERLDDHDSDGMNVLYGDWHAEFMQTITAAGKTQLSVAGVPAEVFAEK